jgi:hypothetical protein
MEHSREEAAEKGVAEDRSRRSTGAGSRWKRRRRLGACVLMVLAAGLVMAWWPMLRMPGTSHPGPLPAADDPLGALAGDLRRHVADLAEGIGERNVLRRPAELAQAADYVANALHGAGYAVARHEYDVSGTPCSNVEAELRGAVRPEEIVVIGAHYDSVAGTPGANDNGSGVAAMLVLAGRFASRKPDRTLRFVGFVNEEPPYFHTAQMGSLVYARRCRQRGDRIVGMLSLETIGYYSDAPGSQKYPAPLDRFYPSTGNFIGFVGNVSSGDLVRRCVEVFRAREPFPCEGAAMPDFIEGVGFSDQWSFWQEGYPAAMVTDTAMFRYPHYHQTGDTPDKIDFDRSARVVRGLEQVIADLAGCPENAPDGR